MLQYMPGEYARIAFPSSKAPIWRAYSFVSSPDVDYLEFFGVTVPGGIFSNQLQGLQRDDELLVQHESYGFMTPDRFVDGEALWLLGTGTGIGPYISMLRHGEIMSRFQQIYLVRGVRSTSDLLPYNEELQQFTKTSDPEHPKALLQLIACISQEAASTSSPHTLSKRITTALADGSLESMAGTTLNVSHSRIMLCGNPHMVEDMRLALHQRGFKP